MTAHAHTHGDIHDHDHDHDHPHRRSDDHHHDHREHLREVGRNRLLIVLAMTAAFMVVEFAGGVLSNSFALMADAGHMLGDVAALVLSASALAFAPRPAPTAKTYGY